MMPGRGVDPGAVDIAEPGVILPGLIADLGRPRSVPGLGIGGPTDRDRAGAEGRGRRPARVAGQAREVEQMQAGSGMEVGMARPIRAGVFGDGRGDQDPGDLRAFPELRRDGTSGRRRSSCSSAFEPRRSTGLDRATNQDEYLGDIFPLDFAFGLRS